MIKLEVLKKTYLTALNADERTINTTRAWRNNIEIFKWCRQRTIISHQEHLRWFDSQSKDPTIQMFGIHDLAHQLIGVCGFTSINQNNQSAEFSLYVNPILQGKGHGKESLEILIHHGFKDLNLNRIWGETFVGNPAAKMFEKLGFVKEGVLRQTYFKEGKFINSIIYSILREDFLK